mmetsp:Transcript_14589/g.29606  ORF Transcript_14589/g.29606 Transcript_14589/m.29606 type:complete len:229 (-) Transcript_14589:275-961(-)
MGLAVPSNDIEPVLQPGARVRPPRPEHRRQRKPRPSVHVECLGKVQVRNLRRGIPASCHVDPAASCSCCMARSASGHVRQEGPELCIGGKGLHASVGHIESGITAAHDHEGALNDSCRAGCPVLRHVWKLSPRSCVQQKGVRPGGRLACRYVASHNVDPVRRGCRCASRSTDRRGWQRRPGTLCRVESRSARKDIAAIEVRNPCVIAAHSEKLFVRRPPHERYIWPKG